MKTYVGNGTKHEKYDFIKVSIDLEKVKPFIYEYNGKKYITVDVAPLREPSQYGKTHSVSVWIKDDVQQSNSNGGNVSQSNMSEQRQNNVAEAFNPEDVPF